MNRRYPAALCLALLLLPLVARAQTPAAPVRDASALNFVQRSLLALTGAAPVDDVTLTGNVTQFIGTKSETGTFTMKALGATRGRIEIDLPSGPRISVRNGSGAVAKGQWSGPDGVNHAMALHNLWTGAVWFLPQLTVLARTADQRIQFRDRGQEQHNNASAEHLEFSRLIPGQGAGVTADIARLSRRQVYLDASTSLPAAFDYTVHPDNNMNVDLAIEVRYSDYRPVQGVMIPFHIQRYLQGALWQDFTVTGVQLNTGLTAADFAINGGN